MLQVVEYLDTVNGTAPPDAIYFLFIGANDYFAILRGANATVEEVLEATAEAMDMLYQAGARVYVILSIFAWGVQGVGVFVMVPPPL